jgi:hypothetical protein
MIRKTLLGLGMGVAMIFANTGSAQAFDLRFTPAFKTIVVHERVQTFEIRTVPVTKIVTEFDRFGRPVHVKKTFFKEVKVPVVRVIAVKKRVPFHF